MMQNETSESTSKGDGVTACTKSSSDSSPSISQALDSEKREASVFDVTSLDKDEHPQSLPKFRKWLAVWAISTSALCVACCSSAASFTQTSISQDFHVSTTVSILSISLFVEGLGWGPLLVGPLSEVYGRNIIYRVSYALLFAFSFAVTFAPDIAVFLLFRFITGFCGSAFLSVAGGSMSDLFDNAHVALPMAVFTLSPFCGPILGPLMSGFINQHANWRWTYRVLHIWIFVQLLELLFLVPETYEPVLLKRKAQRLRRSTGDSRYMSPVEKRNQSLASAIIFSCYTPFKLILFDRMVLLLNTWNSLLLGILYLTFEAFPIIFEKGHGFDMQSTGMSFIGLGIGIIVTLGFQPLVDKRFKRIMKKYNGNPPPETRLFGAKIGAIIVPLSLFFLAFTTYPHVHWIVPIIASAPFGLGMTLAFISTFTYLVTAYRPIAASAMASNSAMRSAFAAVFPLFATAMYTRLGTVGATALLAGLSTIMAPLPYIFDKIGARLREKSPYAV